MRTSRNFTWGRATKILRIAVTAGLVWFVMLSANSCLTHKDVRLRTKSIKEWEARQKQKNAKMRDSAQVITACTSIPSENLDSFLTSDYQDLITCSKVVKEYGITQESFNQLFWEGVTKSYDFYLSPEYIDQKSLTNLIDRNLLASPKLVNPSDNPGITKTSASKAFESLNEFSGEWHGNWKDLRVHHRWLPARECKKTITESSSLIGFQSCFTGDGIGWNYVVEKRGETIVLGFVYHFNDDGNISARNPHYAFLNPDNQLTWVSGDHIYVEFVRNHSVYTNEKQYVITGAQYEKQRKEMKLISGFQAIYSSEDQRLPVFKQFQVNKARVMGKTLFRPLLTFIKGLFKRLFTSDSVL